MSLPAGPSEMAPGQVIDRQRPACCGAVENWVHARHKDAHRQKVKGARSIINTGWSQREEDRIKASRRNVKREQLQEDRFQNIERENLRLLMRMQEIDKRRELSARAASKAAAKLVLGGAQPAVSSGAAAGPMPRSSSCPPGHGRGSNFGTRIQAMRRIDDENRRLLKRIQGAKPSVNYSKLEEQHQAQQRIMRMRRENLSREELADPLYRPPRLPIFEEVPFSHRSSSAADLDNMSERLFHLRQASDDAVEASENDAPESESGAAETSVLREYIGGKLPEASRVLAAALMEEHFGEAADDGNETGRTADHAMGVSDQVVAVDAEEAAEASKAAAAEMLRAAEAMDVQVCKAAEPLDALAGGDVLDYANVVARSRAGLQAADAMLAGVRRDPYILGY